MVPFKAAYSLIMTNYIQHLPHVTAQAVYQTRTCPDAAISSVMELAAAHAALEDITAWASDSSLPKPYIVVELEELHRRGEAHVIERLYPRLRMMCSPYVSEGCS